jgi:aryl-alcohol dehydrogenase-like predicted oxidoreductase
VNYKKLGRTGLLVSQVLLGGWNFGKVTSEEESHGILDRGMDVGINLVDTANRYGRGLSEEIIGRWFQTGGHRRDKMILTTKVYGAMSDWPNDSRLSARHIRHAAENSLRRLQTDYIDVYQLHHVDRMTPWEEIWQAMDQLITQGKVIYAGSSNFAGWHIAQAQESAHRHNLLGLVSEQCLYNLAERSAEQEVIPAAASYGLGVLPWSPLHGGALAGPLPAATEGRRRRLEGRGANYTQSFPDRINRYEQLCVKHEMEPAHVALAWLMSRPEVTAPVIGPRTLEHLESALGALEIELDEAFLEELEKLFPGPGASPESFAW